MVCLYCQGELSVRNSRPQKRSNQTWRRRSCQVCGAVFTTTEAVDLSQALVVAAAANGNPKNQLAPFDRDRLFVSLYKSLQHRPTAVRDARSLADTVIAYICGFAIGSGKTSRVAGTVSVDTIYNTILLALQRFDQAAATHYAAFHPAASRAKSIPSGQ